MKLSDAEKAKLKEGHCPICKKTIPKGRKYCSNACQLEAQYLHQVQNWKEGTETGITGTGIKNFLRRYMLEKTSYACEICGWNAINPVTGNSPLNIHHIDGDYTNNDESNLQVLCPNCHSLTDNYGSLNVVSRRINRNKYTKRNKCPKCGNLKLRGSELCRKCSQEKKNDDMKVIDWPSNEELSTMVRKYSLVSLGEYLGVSDNAIRKHCISRNIEIPKGKKTNIIEERK